MATNSGVFNQKLIEISSTFYPTFLPLEIDRPPIIMPHKPLSNLYNKRLGQLGEELAKRYLQKLGYALIKSNYRLRNGQIDLICRNAQNQLIFIEVKTRADESPEMRLSFGQARAIQRTARHFLGNYH